MSKPKQGKLINTVPPAAPDKVHVADNADPGAAGKVKAQELAQQTGKYGETKAPAFKPIKVMSEKKEAELAAAEQAVETTWVGIELVDELGDPVCGQKYSIELPDGTISVGTTDAEGKAKVDGFAVGDCKLTLELNQQAWD